MSFSRANFDPTGSGSHGVAPKIATYITSDAIATVEGASYFNAVADNLKTGDMLLVHSTAAADGGMRLYQVAKSGTTVTLTRRVGGEKVYVPFVIGATELAAGTPTELIAPCAGRISLLRTTVQVAIVTGGAITVEVNTVAVDGLSITVADSATVGTRQSDAPTAAHATAVVAAGDRIEIIPAAGFNGGGAMAGILEIEPSS